MKSMASKKSAGAKTANQRPTQKTRPHKNA